MIGLKRSTSDNEIPVFISELEVAQGGFRLSETNLAANSVVPAGSCMHFDESTRVATVVKTATVNATAGGSAVEYQVKKNHNLVVGDYLAKTVGSAAYEITEIDTTNTDYDVVTVGTTLGAASAFDVLFVSSAEGETAAALPLTPKGLLRSPIELVTGFAQECGVVIRGTAYDRRIPGASATMKTAMPLINFSQSL